MSDAPRTPATGPRPRVNTPLAALIIVKEATLYRIRRREANNWFTSVSLMVALGLPWADLGFRALYAALLNVYVYLMNDYFDIERDLASPQKDHRKAQFMADHRAATHLALFGLSGLLLAGAIWHSRLMVLTWALNTVVVGSYSAWFKRVPIADVVLMTICGVTMSLVAIPEQGSAGWALVGFLGVICASFEVIQVIRDAPGDAEAGVTTTAVLLGARGAAWLFRGIVVLGAAYGLWVIGTPLTLALLPAAVFPLSPERASRTWDWCRILFGLTWLGLLVQTYLSR